ncbi:MAG TPA: hypothetical protein GXZ60_13040 [Intrasporangiaceae bacterium]|nr:hypothetical protein [Intrasporangiaceae bacterium]
MPSRERWIKLLGLGTIIGVAASGALVARAARPRRDYERWEITERLHRRYDEARERLEVAEGGVWGAE